MLGSFSCAAGRRSARRGVGALTKAGGPVSVVVEEPDHRLSGE